MRIETLIESQAALNLVTALARAAPPWLGYRIAVLATRIIASRRNSAIVKGVRANQWVVSGGALSGESLDQAVLAALEGSARSIYEVYHYLQDLESAGSLFRFDDSVMEILDRPAFDRRGLVVAGLHLSNFDLGLQWLCSQWIRPLALTIPNPEGGRKIEFEIRKRTGVNLVPASVNGLRQAIRHLQSGGIVATGIDRPQADAFPQPTFFGRPANLPTHYVYLALRAQAEVRIVYARLELDGKYHLCASEPIEMDPYPDRLDQKRCNAEKVLSIAEGYIRQSPEQWSMTKPVWPETIDHSP